MIAVKTAANSTISIKMIHTLIVILLVSDTLTAFPAIPRIGMMPDKAEIAFIPALTERLRANKIGIRKRAVVDDSG